MQNNTRTNLPAVQARASGSPLGCLTQALAQAIAGLLGEGLDGRVLAVDRIAAVAYGEFAARRRAAGKPVAAADAQVAAIARARGAAPLASRDAGGFQGCGVRPVNPWAP